MRKFKRPLPLKGSPEVMCAQLKIHMNVLITELEEEMSRMERKIAEMEKQIKGGKRT